MKNKNVSRNGAERSVWTVLKTQSVNAIILHQTRIRNYILQNIYICDKKKMMGQTILVVIWGFLK